MKILHTADWHLGAYVGPQCDDPMKRMENTMKCLDFLVETANKEYPDIILVCGDIFHQAKVWADRALTEVTIAGMYINLLSEIAPVVVIYGTPNHDGMNQFIALQEMIKDDARVDFITEPKFLRIMTESGPIQVAGLPGFDKGIFRAKFPGLSAEEENRVFSEQLDLIVQSLSAQVDASIPSVLMAHHTVIGCEFDNGQHVFQANEVVLSANTLDNSNFDLVCLGHIHKAQRIPCSKPIFYAGSLDAFTFNDECHKKGFWIHTINENWRNDEKCRYVGELYKFGSTFIKTPAREFQTFVWSPEYTANYVAGNLKNADEEMVKNRVVRILYACDEATEKALDKKKLERDLYAAGAYYVAEIRPEKITATVNQERMTEKLTVNECLARYLKEKGKSDDEISATLEEASNIIAEASANMPAGSQTGVFLPVEISVLNYRSYAEETLSFEGIYFAMVNGRNGSGKSSLFMDVIVDCLYEEPREGDLTGWIRNGEKSGSISFTFKLGKDLYRVARTRQRTGKATLALAKLKDGQWVDQSCEKMVDTQKKIIDLLGMDADTFRSCVLIMQDQYGRFMESKPEERMAVLASLLGLGIYEQLEKIAKEELRLTNREMKETKIMIMDLDEEVSQENDLLKDLKVNEVFAGKTKDELTALRQSRDEVRDKVEAAKKAVIEQQELQEEIKNQESLYNTTCEDIRVSQGKLELTRQFLVQEKEIQEKYAELQTVKKKISSFDVKVGLLKEKKSQKEKLLKELTETKQNRSIIEAEIEKINKELEQYDNISADVEKLPEIEAKLKECEEKEKQLIDYRNTLCFCESKRIYLEKSIASCKKQQDYLNNSGCIDIEKAQCQFLKVAKEDVEKLLGYEKEFEKNNKQIAETQKAIEALNYNADEHQKLKQQLQELQNKKALLASLDGKKKAVEIYNERLQNIPDIEQLQRDIGEIENEITALESDCKEVEKLKNQLDSLKEYEEKWQQIPAARQYEELTEQKIEELKIKSIEQYERLQELKKRQKDIYQLIRQQEKLEESLKLTDSIIAAREETLQKYIQNVGMLTEKLRAIESKKSELEDLKRKNEELATKAARLETLCEAFSQDGIPHQIIRDIIPELEASANEILSQMTGGRMRLEFRTKKTLKTNKSKEVATLDIVLIDIDNGELPYLSRSGGQKVRAALAVSFALAMVKASRVGLQLGMMFVDEPPFLDAEGVEAYCMALESIHERYPDMKIVAISHDENMKARFPQQLTVVQTESGSKVKLS